MFLLRGESCVACSMEVLWEGGGGREKRRERRERRRGKNIVKTTNLHNVRGAHLLHLSLATNLHNLSPEGFIFWCGELTERGEQCSRPVHCRSPALSKSHPQLCMQSHKGSPYSHTPRLLSSGLVAYCFPPVFWDSLGKSRQNPPCIHPLNAELMGHILSE